MTDLSKNLSPPKSYRPRHSDARTRRIVDAARTIFLESGFDGASMDEVALLAGVSKRTVYNRYVSKEELFDQVADEATRQLFSFTFTADPERSVRDELLALAMAVLQSRLNPDSVSLLRNVVFRGHRMESLSNGHVAYAYSPVITAISEILEGRKFDTSRIIDAASMFFVLIREPLEHKLVYLDHNPANLDALIVDQAQKGVDNFLTLFPLES